MRWLMLASSSSVEKEACPLKAEKLWLVQWLAKTIVRVLRPFLCTRLFPLGFLAVYGNICT